jgi:hypothetical protein
MSTRLSETIATFGEKTSVFLVGEGLNDDDASALADALKGNKSVTKFSIYGNKIGAEGASALAGALKVNMSVTKINLRRNCIGDEGASALADALKVNRSVTAIDLCDNRIGNDGVSALADALKVNTSVTFINLNEIDDSKLAILDDLLDRNERLRRLFLFDARQMLLSVLCADECGVVWPYVLDGDDADYVAQASNCFGEVESFRAEFAAVVEERRRRAAIAAIAVRW